VPVILMDDQRGRRLGLMGWGWHRSFLGKRPLINVLSEEIASKPMFAEALHRRRCLVPATAWFEWQAVPGVGTNASSG
jgi:putative SOS response-associated peptidase YedK